MTRAFDPTRLECITPPMAKRRQVRLDITPELVLLGVLVVTLAICWLAVQVRMSGGGA